MDHQKREFTNESSTKRVGIIQEVDGLLAFEIDQAKHLAFSDTSAPGLTGWHDRILQDLSIGIHGRHLQVQRILIAHQHDVLRTPHKTSLGQPR